MSNVIVGGWAALESELLHAVEFASNCAGPDGAVSRVKAALSDVLRKFKDLELAEAPVAEAPVAEAPVAEASVTDPEPTSETK
jgi:hypothetical protein